MKFTTFQYMSRIRTINLSNVKQNFYS